jgi:hypothetical protein
MLPELSIVKVDKRPYRTIAQENWGLTKEQMRGRHVHHRISVSDGGTDDPSNLYVCSPSFHRWGWHNGGEFIEWANEGGRKGGRKTAELGVGVHAPGMASKGGTKVAELGVGIHAPGIQSEAGKKGGKTTAELGLGAHAPGKASEGGKTTTSQKWQSTDPNHPAHISNSGGLSRWQKARGIDTSMRVKLAG